MAAVSPPQEQYAVFEDAGELYRLIALEDWNWKTIVHPDDRGRCLAIPGTHAD